MTEKPSNFFMNYGIFLSQMGRETALQAQEQFNKHKTIFGKDTAAFYNSLACLHHQLSMHHEVIKDCDKALAVFDQGNDRIGLLVSIHIVRAQAYQALNEKQSAADDYEKAYELMLIEGNKDGAYQAQQSYEYMQSLIRDCPPGLTAIHKIMMSPINKEINDKQKAYRETICKFLTEKRTIGPQTPELHVLRRWNSYTPIICNNKLTNRGGGYFIHSEEMGIVIDPGINFLQNFKEAGFHFADIDVVLITHAHNDHCADLEAILTLLHQYNERVKGDYYNSYDNNSLYNMIRAREKTLISKDKLDHIVDEAFATSPKRKRITICLTPSTYRKYINILSLYSSNDYDLIIIGSHRSKNCNLEINVNRDIFTFKQIDIKSILAKHNDLQSDRDAIGFQITFGNTTFLFTGDTGLCKKVEEEYELIVDKALCNRLNIVLIAHIGGFKEYENKYLMENFNGGKAFYKNHLGRLGLARLIEITQPKVCVISEFGEELCGSRIAISKLYSDAYPATAFFPADIGFTINWDMKIRANLPSPSTSQEFVIFGDVKIAPTYGSDESEATELTYFSI